jgi:hypothetical protein
MRDAAPRSRHVARSYGEIDRVIVFGELLGVAMELLAAETLTKDRLALVAVDNLADLLLHRHAERMFESSEGSWWSSRRKFSSRERHVIRKNFDRLLRLAQVHAEAPWGRDVKPILTEDDGTLVRVAHSYRNGVYHDDRHNPAVLSPLVALYAQAVGRAFVLSYPKGIAWSIGQRQADALGRLGYSDTHRDDITNTVMFNFRDGIQQIVDHLVGGWEVPFPTLRTHLADDIRSRSLMSARTVVELLEAGMPEDRLEHVFWWSQFWKDYGADEELQRLDALRFEVDDSRTHPGDDPARAELDANPKEANDMYLARIHELQKTYKPTVNWADASRFGRLANSLEKSSSMSSLLARYERLDAEAEALEDATSAAVGAWDELCEQAAQMDRGD